MGDAAVCQRLHLRPGAAFDADNPALTAGLARLRLPEAGPGLRSALAAMASADGFDAAGLPFDPALALAVNRLEASGWLARTVLRDGVPLVTREPLAYVDVLARVGVTADVPLRTSRFAVLHDEAGQLVLVAGTAHARAVVHDPRVAALLAALHTPALWSSVSTYLGEEATEAVLRVLVQARLVERATDEPVSQAEQQWHALDLAFHARTRLGRRASGYGGTYPFKGVTPEVPGVRPARSTERLALPAPDLAAVAAADPPLTTVLERRHSTRVHDDTAPITAAALGELLYRTSRIRTVLSPDGDGTYALRPYPNGGALYELEVYPVVRLCDGVPAGLYRYDGQTHELEHVADPGPLVEGLLEQARVAALMDEQPQVLLTIAARFPRVSWKYEGMPYALTLKHVGVLYQTVYLVATAMDLAVCGLGGGDADLFARAAGLDYLDESSVGELIIGSVPPDVAGPGIAEVAQPTPSF
ncbi:MAG TPA: SagB family peptide dehydrogenase [Nocardioides sp.]|nr:SagB family peptide dehydrogenase [Nocardioides sp.]